MSLTESKLGISQVVAVGWGERWQVFQRLQELQIPCECLTNQPLRVELNSANEAIQLWSVVRQLRTPRWELANWLNYCWQLDTNITES